MALIRKLWSKFALLVMESRAYAWILYHVVPFIRFSFYYTSLRGKQYREGYALLQPGDIILTRDNWKLTSFLIPGHLIHAALCVAKDDKECFEVSEMVRVGYKKSEFYDVCHEADHVVILRCRDWDDEYIKKVIETCLSFDGLSYDIRFELGIKTLYCSELIVASDPEKRLDVSYDDLIGIGRPYISPMGIYHAKNVDLIWDSKNSNGR
jgi:hypothetical protein|tara:strand:+ start:2050 stop:2676 length:627 start_codon:yes stop_codon:yes gene_type:complete